MESAKISKVPLCKVKNFLLTTGDYVYILKIMSELYGKTLNHKGVTW